MKIFFDNIIFSLQKSGGGSVYWYEIVSRFLKTNHNIEFLDYPCNNIFRERLNYNGKVSRSRYWLFIARFLPLCRRFKSKTIVHSSYYRISLSRNAINVITIHDFTSEKYFRGLSKFINYWQKKIAVMRADGIICISENTKKDLLFYHPKVSENKIKIIYNGAGDCFFRINQLNESNISDDDIKKVLGEEYVLFVGHRTNYKNFLMAVKTMSFFNGKLKFVIVGEPLSKDEITVVNSFLKKDSYKVLSGKTSETLNLLYNKAFCLLYPSSYEGFGIPVVEAMKTGCPVVTTNKSSIPEVAGDAAIMVSEINELNFINAIESLFDDKYRSDLIAKGYIQAEKFSWDYTYKEVVEFYKTLYENK